MLLAREKEGWGAGGQRMRQIPSQQAAILSKTPLAESKPNASHHPPGNTATLWPAQKGILHGVNYSFKIIYF